MTSKHLITFIILSSVYSTLNAQDQKLSGTVIGTEYSVDYATQSKSTTINTRAEAFDGDLNTFFASYDRSFTWVGLELDTPHVITRIGFAPRNDSLGPGRLELGVFQGANNPDFSDALPIYMIKSKPAANTMTYADVTCSKGFKYIRYVGPNDARCNIAEIELYGHSGNGDDNRLYQPTNLPLVVVNTPGMEWFNNDKNYAMEGSQVYVVADGKFDTAASAQIRGRGNASWGFPKKPFRIKFDKKQKVLSGPAKAKKWTMINNYGDKTLMRNILAFEISRRVGMEFTPQCHPVDLIFNGEYQGCYQLCDQVEVNEGRVDITKMGPEDITGEAVTGGYLIEIDAYAYQEAAGEWFRSKGGHNIPVTIKSPDPGITEQYNYIQDFFTAFEKAVFASNFTNEATGYRRYLDLDSFLKHLIVGELSGNTDTYWSVYMYKDRGDNLLHVGPVWDFDIAFENDSRTYPINNKSDLICFSGSFADGMDQLARRIIKQDQGAKDRLKYLWSYAREYQGLDADTFGRIIDEYTDMLAQSQALNFVRWPIMKSIVHMNPKIWGSYEKEVDNVRSYLTKRFDKLDKIIGRVEIDGISDIEAESPSIALRDGKILIEGCSHYTISNLQGIMINSGSGNTEITLPAGIYIVKTDKGVKKVTVR